MIDCYTVGLCYDDLLGFKDLYPRDTEFITFINESAEVAPKFDISKLYKAMCDVYEWDKTKYVSIRGFNTDFRNILNNNIYELNRQYELLSQDYDFVSGIEITTQNDASTDLEGTAEQDTFSNPQYDDIEKSITGRSKGNSTSGQVTSATGSSLTKQKQSNLQINDYLEAYRRFVYTKVVVLFDSMFIQNIG